MAVSQNVVQNTNATISVCTGQHYVAANVTNENNEVTVNCLLSIGILCLLKIIDFLKCLFSINE